MFLKSSPFLLLIVILFSCKKDKIESNSSSPPPLPPLLLKDIVVPRLPSPYYHFEYDSSGKLIFVSFASDLTRYHVTYGGDRIIEMRNDILVNKDRLQYIYDGNGKVKTVNYADSTGIVYTRNNFTFDGQKLVKIEREKNSGGNFIKDKTMTMTYHPDGNLFELTYHYLPVNGMQESTYTDRFEDYDTKINVDGLDLIHNEFFDHLIILQGMQLQKNNPGKETRTGDAQNYVVDYVYTYNDRDQPLNKQGSLLFLNGSNAGQRFETNSIYSYY
jgi:hypothetical protein